MNNDDMELTLPTIEQMFRKKIKKCDRYCKKTDLCEITSGMFKSKYDEENVYWTKSIKTYDHDITRDRTYVIGGIRNCRIRLSNEYETLPAIRPILKSSKIFKEVQKNKIMRSDGVFEVDFGEYPQDDVTKEEIGNILEGKYNMGTINKTGKTYTLPRKLKSYIEHEYSRTFVKDECEEYYYMGEKYVRLAKEFILSKKIEYTNVDYIWLKVKPIRWIIDEELNQLISKFSLLSGITFNPYNHDVVYKDSSIYIYLSNHMIKDIIPSKSCKYNKNEEEVNNILEDINKYKKYYHGKENIDMIIKNLIDNYNANIDNNYLLISSDELTLVSMDGLYMKLVNDLNNVLNILKLNYDINHEYNDILDEINNYILAFNSGNTNIKDDILINDLLIIKNTIFPYVEDKKDEFTKEILSLLTRSRDDITKYLLSSVASFDNKELSLDKIEKLPYSNRDEFILYIRRELQPILVRISISVNKVDLINRVINSMNNIIKGIYEESRNESISMYLNLINELTISIKDKINIIDNSYSYSDRLKSILNFKIDTNMEVKEILDFLNSIIYGLCSLDYEIDGVISNINRFNGYKINIKKIMN